MSYHELRCCVENAPNWPAASDAELADWLNTPSVPHRSENASSREIWLVIIQYNDYEILAATQREMIRETLFGGGNTTIDVSTNDTPEAKLLIESFPGAGQGGLGTREALLEAFTKQIPPWEDCGLPGPVNASHIKECRKPEYAC